MTEISERPDYRYNSAVGSCAHAYLSKPVVDLAKELCRNGRVLDLGCGNGSLSNELAKVGLTVCGIDRSISGIEIAKRQHPHIQFLVGSVEESLSPRPFEKEAFDLLVSTEVVEHLFDPRAFARNAFALLRPGGHLIVSTPYHGYLKNLSLAIAGKFDAHFTALWDGGHIKFWSRATLTNLLEEPGFSVTRFVGAGRLPYLWKSMILIARRPPLG